MTETLYQRYKRGAFPVQMNANDVVFPAKVVAFDLPGDDNAFVVIRTDITGPRVLVFNREGRCHSDSRIKLEAVRQQPSMYCVAYQQPNDPHISKYSNPDWETFNSNIQSIIRYGWKLIRIYSE